METKDTNPKDAIGSSKLPYHLVPSVAIAEEALAFLEGGCKYGAHNYRIAGVRASVYVDAAKRHLDKFWEGEDLDPDVDNLVHHLGLVRACAGILLDAIANGMMVDDRPPRMAPGWVDGFNVRSAAILARHETTVAPYTQEYVDMEAKTVGFEIMDGDKE